MPTFNAEKYLKEAVDSILNQTVQNFEILVIDDGSVDKTLHILESYNDERIKVLQGPRRGIASALNVGIRSANGEFIARMDADDICLPQRFEKQLAAFQTYPDASICAANVELMGVNWEFWGQHTVSHRQFFTRLLWEMPLCHPVVMFKRSVFTHYNLFYNESFTNTEDFELFSRAVIHVNFCGIDEILLRYRMHEGQATTSVQDNGKSNYIRIIKRNFKNRLNIDISDDVAEIFWNSSNINYYPGFVLYYLFNNIKNNNNFDKFIIKQCIKKYTNKYFNTHKYMLFFKPISNMILDIIWR